MQPLKCLLLSLVVFFSFEASISAETSLQTNPTEEALLQSIGERLPILVELKLKGVVGETNMGLVEARGNLEREQRRLLADENRDRLAYYKLISERLGIPVAAVQRKRAEQIRENSPRGVWVESKSGVWYRE
ncbi:DUF1318 domain-containing protein [Coraliomargarita sp. W4R53]